MISIIVPTMWYATEFCDFLSTIVEIPIIGEVVIINNNVEETPDHSVLKNEKVKMHNMPSNIYVAPAWNLGAKLASYDFLAILSDDVIVNTNVFQKTFDFIQDKKDTLGVIAVLTDDVNDHSYHKFFKDDSIDFFNSNGPDPEKRPPSVGMGNLFFIQKKDWIDIPKQIKIFHGEVLIWNYFNTIKTNYVIANCKIETKWHVTWEKLAEQDNLTFASIQQNDQLFCQNIKFEIPVEPVAG